MGVKVDFHGTVNLLPPIDPVDNVRRKRWARKSNSLSSPLVPGEGFTRRGDRAPKRIRRVFSAPWFGQIHGRVDNGGVETFEIGRFDLGLGADRYTLTPESRRHKCTISTSPHLFLKNTATNLR